MKTAFRFFTIIFCTIFFAGCSKYDAALTPTQQAIKNLTGTGNRYWTLQQLFVNDIKQALTFQQSNYHKTYTLIYGEDANGTVSNSDGYTGFWELAGNTQLKETITTSGQPVLIIYTITELSEHTLDMSYTANGTKVREVYYAY